MVVRFIYILVTTYFFITTELCLFKICVERDRDSQFLFKLKFLVCIIRSLVGLSLLNWDLIKDCLSNFIFF